MDRQVYKEVYYHKYCKSCKYAKIKDGKIENTDGPCEECLSEPLNLNSHKPVRYEEKRK